MKNFLQEKESNFIKCRLLWGVESYNSDISKFKGLSEYKDSFLKNYDSAVLINFFKRCTNIELPNTHIREFINEINSYPALRTLIYSHLYLNYKFKNQSPFKDRITDSIQLIEASYFPVFVSGDERHLKYANEINPNIQLISTKDLGIN